MSECDPRIPDELWIGWSKAERCGRWLLRGSGLPSADQEIALDAALEVLLLVWKKGRVVENPAAWLGTLLVRRLHEIRRYGVAGELPADLLAGEAGSEVLDVAEDAEAAAGRQVTDWWQIVLRHEAAVLGKLSEQEQRVYGAVRGGRSLKEVAGELGMSERDVRTRFRRVCDKLDGFLAHLVPPPLYWVRPAHQSRGLVRATNELLSHVPKTQTHGRSARLAS
ncbi:MAG: hypothetical protein JNK49_06010, partial [Planctomycetes bacterium]|nr:hypothetical protein [Planctomycetota bacterium]